MLATHIELATKIADMERMQLNHAADIDAIWRAIDKLVEPPLTPKRQIGFNPDTSHQNGN